MSRVELHLHTMYSFLDGVDTPEDYVKRAKELGMTALGISDHGSTMGLFHFYEACKKENIKPILGVELYTCREFVKVVKSRGKGEKKKVDRLHLLVFAKNFKGYENLLKLCSFAYETFNYRPILTIDDLFQYKEGLIVTSACVGSAVQTEEDVIKMKKEFGDDFYLEVHPLNLDKEWDRDTKAFEDRGGNLQYEHNEKMINWSKKYNIPLVVSTDVHYAIEENNKIQDIFIMNSFAGKSGWHFYSRNHYLMSKDEIWDEFKKFGHDKLLSYEEFEKAIQNGFDLADKVDDYKLDKLPEQPPHFPLESHPLYVKGDNAYTLTAKIIKDNKKIDTSKKEYIQRLTYELGIIREKDFLDYFLIIEDIIRWCKDNDVMVGPGRGSVGGSLLAYALDITKLDPIEWNLPFERFLDLTRTEYPDIDLDFEDQGVVKDYLKQKYGYDKVMDIGVYQTIKTKTAIKDAYRILKGDEFDYGEINKVTKNIPNSPAGCNEREWFESFLFSDTREAKELQSFFLKNKDRNLLKTVSKMVGKIKTFKVHPCAIVISNTPLDGLVPTVINKPNSEEAFRMTGYDGTYCAKSGLLKFDILSLNTLREIKTCVRFIKQKHGKELDVYTLLPNDAKVLEEFKKGNTESVFQYNTVLSTPLVKKAKVDHFRDLTAITALGRPGPIGAGLSQQYIDHKTRTKKIIPVHPVLDKILEETFGVMIYQEQIMEIFQKMGGFSAVESNSIRKSISKSKSDQIVKVKDKFVQYATIELDPPMPKEQVEKLFNNIKEFGNYCFNRAHSCCYAYIGYICQYLKTYYHDEWWTSVLTNSSQDDIGRFLKHLEDKIDIPEINQSRAQFYLPDMNRKLAMPLKFINQVGPNAITEIVLKQPYSNFEDFYTRVNKRSVKKNVIDNLILTGVFRDIEPDKTEGQLLKYFYYLRKDDLPEQFIKIDDKIVLERAKRKAFSFRATDWVEDFNELFGTNTAQDLDLVKDIGSRRKDKVRVGGRIDSVERRTTKGGKDFYRFTLNNRDTYLNVYVWEEMIPQVKNELVEDYVVEVVGTTSKYGLALESMKRIVL